MRTEHLTQYDAIRIVAALGVVATHEAGAFPQLVDGPGAQSVGMVVFSATRWCVPVFILLSGALLLKNSPNESLRGFYTRRFAKILPPVLFWTFAYGMRVLLSGKPHALQDVVMRVALGMAANHLWYLYMLMGLYLATPFLTVLFIRFPPKTIGTAAGVLLTFLGIDTTFSLLFGSPGRHTRTFLLYWMPYVGYYLAGRPLGSPTRQPPEPRRLALLFTILAVSIVLGVAVNFAIPPTLADRETFISSYFNPFVILQSLVLFRLLSSMDFPSPESHRGRWMACLGQLTFGTYLVHPMVSQVISPFRLTEPSQAAIPEAIAILAIRVILVTAISVSVTAVTKRIPYLRHVV